MPTISRFLGIIISMYHNDHPPPHFHVVYGDAEAEVEIESLEMLHGTLPPRVLGLVREWAGQRQEQLRVNWYLAREHRPLRKIKPLT